jgi:hypothetical protein
MLAERVTECVIETFSSASSEPGLTKKDNIRTTEAKRRIRPNAGFASKIAFNIPEMGICRSRFFFLNEVIVTCK